MIRTAVIGILVATVPLLSGATGPTKPKRIMSMMQCNDLMVLQLVPKARISSVTYLAHRPAEVLMPGADRGVRINHGTAEEMLLEKPDVVLAGTYSTPVARRLAKKIGANLIEVGPVNSFDDIRTMTRQIGAAVGEPERAEAMIARMDRTLAALDATKPKHPLRVAAWTTGGRVPGKGTLTDAVIRAAGGTNIAASLPDARYGSYSNEELLAAKPDAILQGQDRYDQPSLAKAKAAHPLIERLYRNRRIVYPDSLYTCGLPQTAEAARSLRRALLSVPKGPVF